MPRIPRQARYAAVAALAIFVGTGIVAYAKQLPIGSLFYVPLLDGVPSQPCNSETVKGLTTTTCHAVVDSRGQLAVSDADTHTSLGRLKFDSSGNLQTSGNTTISNFPANQQVNFGGVSQPVTVQNFPAPPAATKAQNCSVDGLPPKSAATCGVGFNVTFLHMDSHDKTQVLVVLQSGASAVVLNLNGETREISFAQPLSVNYIRTFCDTLFTKCTYVMGVFGN